MSKKDVASKLEEITKANAKKLLDILNGPNLAKLREEHQFTLESLRKEYKVTVEDCQHLQQHAKILFESGKYQGKSPRVVVELTLLLKLSTDTLLS